MVIAVLSFLAYLLNQFLLKELVGGRFFMFYFNDFLYMMVSLPIINIICVYLLPNWQFRKIVPVMILTILASVWWEVLIPLTNSSTPDWLDVMFYFLGSFCYWLLSKLTIPTQ